MKDFRYKYIVLFILLLFLSSYSRVNYHAERIIKKDFTVDVYATLKIINEYGNLTIKTWNKNTISFDVRIQAESDDENLANKLVQESDVKFENTKDGILAISNRSKTGASKSWWKFWENKKHSLKIHYSVNVPKSINLDLKNAYGNIYCEDIDGNFITDLQYGELSAADISDKVELDLKHVEANLGKCGNTEIDVQYSEIKILKTGILKVNSTHSEITIGESLDANIYSRYDRYKIGTMDNLFNEGSYDEIDIQSVRSVSMSADYSELTIEECEVAFDLNISHGEAIIEKTLPAFNSGKLAGEYTDYNITINQPFSFDIDGDYTDIDLPSGVQVEEKRNENHLSRYKGKSGPNPISKFSANLRYGSLNIE